MRTTAVTRVVDQQAEVAQLALRLALQLAAEHRPAVRVLVDALGSLASGSSHAYQRAGTRTV